jgi:hypothetical protein
MYKRALLLLLFLALTPAGWSSEAASPQDDDELVINGGFEIIDETGLDPEAWGPTILPATADFVSFRVDDQVSRSGQKSALIEISPRHPVGRIDYNWVQSVPAFSQRKKYKLIGYIKTENVFFTPVIVVQSWNTDFTEMIGFATTQFNHNITGTRDWKKVKIKFKVPDRTAAVFVRLVCTSDNNGAKVWFDDVSIRPR